MRSFVVGNGTSRLGINLNTLKQYGKIYGCNALYREFEPDYLIAVDAKMIIEIEKTGYQLTHEVWTNTNAKYKNFNGFKYFNPSMGWSSGPTALHLATSHKPLEIYILGFDYIGNDGNFNNIYANTDNYRKSSDPATYYGNWKNQTEQVIKSNPEVKYYRVVGEKYFNPEWNYHNFKHIKYKEFDKLIETWPKRFENQPLSAPFSK